MAASSAAGSAVYFLAGDVGGRLALLLTLLIGALAQMGYGALCRHFGRPLVQLVYRFTPLLPGMFFLRGVASDLITVVFDICNLVATLGWSDDDIGGWGRRRWAQVRQATRRFSKPMMGGLTPRA